MLKSLWETELWCWLQILSYGYWYCHFNILLEKRDRLQYVVCNTPQEIRKGLNQCMLYIFSVFVKRECEKWQNLLPVCLMMHFCQFCPMEVQKKRSHWRSNLAREYGCYLQFCLLIAILQQLSPFPEVGAFLSLLKNPKEKKTKTQLSISLILVHTTLQHTVTLIPAILFNNPWSCDK